MFKINIHKKYIFSLFVVMKTNFYSGKSMLKWMIRIEKGTFLYQKQKTSDQNTTKLSFVFSTHITFGLFGQCLIIRKGEYYQLFIVNFSCIFLQKEA